MDFYKIGMKVEKKEVVVYPSFQVNEMTDLMVQGGKFYAVWNEEKGFWSTNDKDAARIIDKEIEAYIQKNAAQIREFGNENGADPKKDIRQSRMRVFESGAWEKFLRFIKSTSDTFVQLDSDLTFASTPPKKERYASKFLPYSLESGTYEAWTELVSTLYEPDELAKIEWMIGAILSGDSKSIQKFSVFYGSGGTGKSTIINIIQALFEGYYAVFDAKALGSSNSAFAMETFKSNPLVAIQHDGDLSKIEDNTKLNSIVAHEEMVMNEKYKSGYMIQLLAYLIMGTNKPVKITESKSGLIRRLIDIHPTGNKISAQRYQVLMGQINFELGSIAQHCLDVYHEMGKHYYDGYKPMAMMQQTDIFYNFVEENYFLFKEQDGVSLSQAFNLYKQYCDDALIEYKMPRHVFRGELENYFETYDDRLVVDGVQVRSWFGGFMTDRFISKVNVEEDRPLPLSLDSDTSIFDEEYGDCLAQYANEYGTPISKWDEVETKLSDLDTSKVHYVRPPENHIVIDFDLKNEEGEKDAELNLEAASKWPPTYAEFSQGGAGIHLHYIYDGDVSALSRIHSEGIEIKVFSGLSSLRRRLSKANNLPIAIINSGLSLKEKKVINQEGVKSERALRDLVERNLRKEIHPGTKPSIDFIHKILQDAYDSGLSYDLTDMRPRVYAFANNSSNQALYCLNLYQTMQFQSAETIEAQVTQPSDPRVAFYDVEVFPNLFVVCWKYEGSDTIVRMINPTPTEIGGLMELKLVGFNVRRYDNHILWARYMGYSNEQLYALSQRLIDGSPNAYFGEAYNLSYADIYDFASKKQSLKKWEIELGIHHLELGLPWNEPVPEELWEKVGLYCENDVTATEAVWDHLEQDFVARQILSDLSGLPVNSTTQSHTARIVFGKDRDPQKKFVYTNLATGEQSDGNTIPFSFEGYKYKLGKSTYREEEVGEGGLVRAKPGMYSNVGLIDVASMHPNSIKILNMFGTEYTKNFYELVEARLAIKHKDYAKARTLLGGKLAPYLKDESAADALSYALKIVINIVYGLTSASFNNPFRDPRNKDNICAKVGALFMMDLKVAVEEQGYEVVHIKTDSIKIANVTDEIIQFVIDFGAKYGYTFEHEATYEKMCLVNKAVYIAKVGWAAKESKIGKWEAVGAEFQHPIVYKTLFDKEKPLQFEDWCEAKQVKTAIYLDFEDVDTPMALETDRKYFVGKVGLFVPVTEGGGVLLRQKEDGFDAVTGTKGYRWMEAEMVKELHKEDLIDKKYYDKLVNDALDNISQYGDTEWFLS